jgi:hypothetical protein
MKRAFDKDEKTVVCLDQSRLERAPTVRVNCWVEDERGWKAA